MDEIIRILGVVVCSLFFKIGKGQRVPNEMLLNDTFCDLQNMSFTCEKDKKFAFESLNFYHNDECESQCCGYNSSDSNVGADDADIQTIRRKCSGKMNCSLDLTGDRLIGSAELQTPSYAVLQYYCIPGNRTKSICANEKMLESSGLPLYLTNDNYPLVTTGMDTCSCSLEVNTCSSDVTISILDLDLYLDQETCEQNIELRNGTGNLLEILHCGNYNDKSMAVRELRSHYVKITFINNSTQNQEGLFLIGFAASEENVSLSLSCPFQRETVCLQCEDTIIIPNGDMVLYDFNNTGEGAMANVTCDTGYEPDKRTIKCLKTGKWENATCFQEIECEDEIKISNGDMVLYEVNETKGGTFANITCHTGYEPDKRVIRCSVHGEWENVTCHPIDCGIVSDIKNGKYTLNDEHNTTFGAMATVNCDVGYKSDINTIRCSEKGEWSNSFCTAKDCGMVSVIKNGKYILNNEHNTTFGAMATVTCDEGYKSDINTIKCSEKGEWSNSFCTIKDCGTPTTIKYGSVTLKGDSKTTYKSTAEIKCEEGFKPKKQMIKCNESGLWESSTCEHISENEDKTGTIIAALLSVLIIGGLLLLGLFCFMKYRRKGYLLRSFSSKGGHESVSFKNKEVLPEEGQGQNTNLVFSNETEHQEGHQTTDSKEPQDKEKSHQEEQKGEESNKPLMKAEQGGNLNDDVKNEEAEQCQKIVETNVNREENVTGQDSYATSENHKNSDPKEDNKTQEASKTSDTSTAYPNEDVKSTESKETHKASKNDIKEEVKSQNPGETSQVCSHDSKEEDVNNQKGSEKSEASKTDQNEDRKGKKSSEINEASKNDAKDDVDSQTPCETSKVNTIESKEDVKGQETINTNEENKSEEASKTSDTSMADQNEDVKSTESKETHKASENDIKEEVKSQTPGETSQVCSHDSKEEDLNDQKGSEKSEASKNDQNEDRKGKKSIEINEASKNDAKDDVDSQKPCETSKVKTIESKEDVKGQETINTNEENKSEGSKVDIGQTSK